MASEVLKEILGIEEKADMMLKQASQNAKEIIRMAEEEAERIIDGASKEGDINSAKIIEDKKIEAGMAVQAIVDEQNKNCDSVRSVSSELLERSVNLVIERIVKPHGNS